MIADTELILDDEGRIYHLRLRPQDVADKVILVGDPGRVEVVSGYFDDIEVRSANREIHTHTGHYRGVRISVISTGMGPDNIDIVLNELDALVNMDLKNRVPKEKKRSLELVRIGTTGSLQGDIPAGAAIASLYGVGLDGIIYFYGGHQDVIHNDIADAFIEHTEWPKTLMKPYFVDGSNDLINKVGQGFAQGITITSPGFYGPQGRMIRIPLAHPEINDKLTTFRYKDLRITNYEMETAAIFGLSKLMGHQAASVCLVLANRVTGEYVGNHEKPMTKLIEQVVENLVK